MIVSETEPGFPENGYGDVKRLRVFTEWLERASRALGRDTLDVLDFGCGTGARMLVPLSRTRHNFHGVDVHEPTIRLASRTSSKSNLRFSAAPAAELRRMEERYDVVIASEVLEHLDDPEEHIAIFYEILRPGGFLFVTVPNGFGSYEKLHRLEDLLERIGVERAILLSKWPFRAAKWLAQGRGLPPAPGKAVARNLDESEAEGAGYLNVESGHVQFFDLETLVGLFRRAGFETVESRGKILLCGPYADFWMNLLSKLPFGGLIFKANNALAEKLPLKLAADWMFLLRRNGAHV